MDKENEVYYCNTCPKVSGGFCIPKNEQKRLFFTPLTKSPGPQVYAEPQEIAGSVKDCPDRPS